jgi:hypothetical protein
MLKSCDLPDREGEPSADDCLVERIEISFAIPSWITPEQQMEIADFVQSVAKRPCNTPRNGVHWHFGSGSKPSYSQADQRFLGLPVDLNAPETGEPEFDDTVLFFETATRNPR